jgi:hypothetical protein
MADPRLEYVDFKVNKSTREYRLRAKLPDGEYQDFTLAILNEAFIDRRVRYQDAPDICFLKLQREMDASGDSLPALHHELTNDELEEYRLSHTPKPKEKRRRALPES